MLKPVQPLPNRQITKKYLIFISYLCRNLTAKGSCHSFILAAGNVAKSAAPLIQSFAKERNRELLSICYVCTDMNRKLSMLYGAILIIHFKPIDPISHIYHLSPLLVCSLLKHAATPTPLA